MLIDPDHPTTSAQLAAQISALGIDRTRRHIFLCCDQGKPKCSTREASLESWEYLKRRLRELGLGAGGGIYRTKANCLQVCLAGPIAAVLVCPPLKIKHGSGSPLRVLALLSRGDA